MQVAKLQSEPGSVCATAPKRGPKLVKDTQDEGDQSTQGQSHPEMGHPVIQRGHGHPVGEDTLEADEEQPRGERHAGPHVVERLGVIHLMHRSSQRG